MVDYLNKLESEEPSERIEALEYIAQNIEDVDKIKTVKSLKNHILDWDEDVRINVARVLKLYTRR